MFAAININKPLHCTSHDVVAKIRKKLGIKKVGHCGTLDPLAQGVLPICAGGATRLIEYLPSDKQYLASITFGRITSTWDSEGEVIGGVSACNLTRQMVEAMLPKFRGKIMQQLPPHSAVHVRGKKLYEYARKGIKVELPVREAEVLNIQLVEFQNQGEDNPIAVVDIHCASGTYIRSIAEALGRESGFGAFLSGLVRTRHGKFRIEESLSLESFLASERVDEYLLNPVDYLTLPMLSLSTENLIKVRNGMKLSQEQIKVFNNRLYLLTYENMPVAVAAGEETGRLKPLKVFTP